MQLPTSLIHSLQSLPGFDEKEFEAAHNLSEKITSIRINPAKNNEVPFKAEHCPVPWTQFGYYLVERPSFTFDPLFHAGCYYVQEASSMFLEQALKQTLDLSKPLKVLDLCAAPGGKSTHIHSLISKDSLLVSNEVIKQRANILKENIIKWGSSNVVVTNNDPKDFSQFKGYFDVIIVDAPCSGSGLFRKDETAITEWSENNVALCSQRQQRILADVLPALKEGGILIYSTCSFSKQEDEDILDWLTANCQLASRKLSLPDKFGINEVVTSENNYGYRFWPDKVRGEGFFIAAFENTNSIITKKYTSQKIKLSTKKLTPLLKDWICMDDLELINVNNTIYAWPQKHFKSFDELLQKLRVIYSGTLVGELAHQQFNPSHALAMSPLASEEIDRVNVPKELAIAYLQKKDFSMIDAELGWNLFCYNTHPMGWAKVLKNRINNYYPKGLRILKDNVAN